MDRQERELDEIHKAFKEIGAESVLRADRMVEIGQTKGFQKAMAICDRMAKQAPSRDEMYKRESEKAAVMGKNPPCRLCAGIGYVSAGDNVARICSCRRAAQEAARRRQKEQERPKADIVSALFDDDDAV